jgi:hypothetical protein
MKSPEERAIGWEKDEQDEHGKDIGRDPRKMTVAELKKLGHAAKPLLSVIRTKCLDCCAGQAAEVRYCVAFHCANWPYRMSKNPFRSPKITDTDERRAQRLAALAKARSAKSAP